MSGEMERKELQEALCRYTTDTLTYMNTVKEFCEMFSPWMLSMATYMLDIVDIKDRADKIDLNIDHVKQSEHKGKAFYQYMKSKVTQVTADSRRAELQQELAAVLKDTLGGLEKLDCFLDAVEKLAVTSLHVFMEENQALHLPKGISPEQVQVVITAARLICPLLLEFKRDASVFFLPKLQNAEVLSYQLDKYIQITQKICEKLETSSFNEFCQKTTMKTEIDLDVDLSEDDIQRMLCHINQLDEIRMDQNFRMVFLFQEVSCSGFMDEFNNRQPRMLQFLKDLEETAVQLDRMNKRAKISSVAGNSVGAVGGVLSIVGLALIPVTAGVSLALTMTGVVMGVTSGVNSAVTTATEIGVNCTQQKKAGEVFQSFMEDVQILQDCLDEVTSQPVTKIEESNIGAARKGIDYQFYAAYADKMLNSEELMARVSKMLAQEGTAVYNISRLASDIPDIGQAAVKGPLIAANALFLGLDIFCIYICKNSISLAKGSETELSQFIRARAALWSSEMDSWQKIHDSLRKGLLTSEKNKAIMEMTFK